MNRLRLLPRSRTRRLGLAGLSVLAVSVIAIGCSKGSAEGTPAPGGGGGGRGGRGGGGQPVVTAKVAQKNMPVDVPAVGNVEAYNSISVTSQITGQIQQAFFKEGDIVKKGDLLFKIDPRPLQASLDQSVANEARDQALLNQAEAQLARDAASAEYQQLTSERQAQLAKAGIISKDAAEQVQSAADALTATVNADKANIESAKAQLTVQKAATDSAKVQLEYTDIKSPIDGKTGNNTVKVGNLATLNEQLVTITQLEPVFVTFTVPAVHLPTIKSHMGANNKPLSVVATPQDEDQTPADGTLIFVDNLVDASTDTIKLKAVFPNTDRRLWPGQFTKVNLRLSTLMDATVVPSQAVQTGQDGQYVFVVKDNSTVEQRPIVVAQRVGEDVVIDKGVKPGETIVTEGQLRLENGTRVQTPNAGGGGGGRGRQGGGQGGQGQGAAQGQGQGAGQGQGQGGGGRGQ
jgi:multidrug efflux system membrane fusion protein